MGEMSRADAAVERTAPFDLGPRILETLAVESESFDPVIGLPIGPNHVLESSMLAAFFFDKDPVPLSEDPGLDRSPALRTEGRRPLVLRWDHPDMEFIDSLLFSQVP
jgi:hypothetical protein